MARECMICGEEQGEETQLLELPCFNHWVCKDDISGFFQNATTNESLFPPSCCDEPILLDRYADDVPQTVQSAFRTKEQGEYTIMPKYRVYCARPSCGQFLHPNGHIKDADSSITYAVCDDEDCFQATCVSCKTLLPYGVQNHACAVAEHDLQFKDCVEEQGYKECSVCGITVELKEACNHISCPCGNNFCYICGKDWEDIHGCPQYGPPDYDDEGYNIDGFHRDTGRNRDGRTRDEQINFHQRGTDDSDEENEEDEEDDRQDHMGRLWNHMLTHVDPDRRAFLGGLTGELREDAMIELQIELMTRGIALDVNHSRLNVQSDNDSDSDTNDDDDDEDNEEDQDEDEDEEEAQGVNENANEDNAGLETDSGPERDGDDGVISDAGSNIISSAYDNASWETVSSTESPIISQNDSMEVDGIKGDGETVSGD